MAINLLWQVREVLLQREAAMEEVAGEAEAVETELGTRLVLAQPPQLTATQRRKRRASTAAGKTVSAVKAAKAAKTAKKKRKTKGSSSPPKMHQQKRKAR